MRCSDLRTTTGTSFLLAVSDHFGRYRTRASPLEREPPPARVIFIEWG